MVSVACEHENAGDDMVGEHLPVILPPLLDVDNNDLLYPEGELYQVIPFEQAIHFTIGPISPQLACVKPVFGAVHYVLYM